MAAMSSFVFEIFAGDVVSIGSRKIASIKRKYLTLSSLLLGISQYGLAVPGGCEARF
jgi:hypothetical protein